MRFAAVAAVAVIGTLWPPFTGHADALGLTPVTNLAPVWMLQYSTNGLALGMRTTRVVTTHPDGSLTWQQIDVNTGLVGHGPVHRCSGSAQLGGDELRAMTDAAQAVGESRARVVDGGGEIAVRADASVSLIVPGANGHGEVTTISVDTTAPDTEPRLKRAATIWARYRCTR